MHGVVDERRSKTAYALTILEGALLVLKLVCYSALAVPLVSFAGHAAQLDDHQLQQIRDTAASVCNTVKEARSTKDDIQIQGDVKAELGGLARRLGANAEVSGKGAINRSEFEGLTQEATAIALSDDRGCRERLFGRMFDAATSAPVAPAQPARNPNALYQYGEVVAEVQGAVISQANGSVTFQVVRTFGKANPTREVEYQDWVLTCPHLPTPPLGAIVGQFNGMLAGERCTIIRKLSP